MFSRTTSRLIRFVHVLVADDALHLIRGDDSVGAVEHIEQDPEQGRTSAHLVGKGVGAALHDDLVAPLAVEGNPDEVGHRAGGHQHGGLPAEEFGNPFLQRLDSGVLTEDVVSHLGCGHRFPHAGGRLGERIRAEVECNVLERHDSSLFRLILDNPRRPILYYGKRCFQDAGG